MNTYRDGLYQISTRRATYGVTVERGRIADAAPIARRYKGWLASKAFADLRWKYGADVQRIEAAPNAE